MKAVVLCAGYGTRLGALTSDTPKPMLPIGGEPLLAHTLRWLRAQGVDRVCLNLHFRPDVIRAYFGTGEAFGLRITYMDEPVLLGTAGAVRSMAGLVDEADALLVVYGDLLLDEDLAELARVHAERGADATLLLHQREGSNSLVRLALDGRITGFVERPGAAERAASPFPWVNSGVAILGSRARRAIPERVPADLPRDVYAPLVETLRIYGVPLRGYRCAIDSAERYAAAEAAYQRGAYRRAPAR